jgi:hypothetical protein
MLGVTETDSPDDQSPETDTSALSVPGQNRDNTQRPTLAPVLAASEAATGAAVRVIWQTRSKLCLQLNNAHLPKFAERLQIDVIWRS